MMSIHPAGRQSIHPAGRQPIHPAGNPSIQPAIQPSNQPLKKKTLSQWALKKLSKRAKKIKRMSLERHIAMQSTRPPCHPVYIKIEVPKEYYATLLQDRSPLHSYITPLCCRYEHPLDIVIRNFIASTNILSTSQHRNTGKSHPPHTHKTAR